MAYGQGLTHNTKPFRSQMHMGTEKQVLRSLNTFNEIRTQEHRAATRKNNPMGLIRGATEIECKKGIAKNATTNHVGCTQPKGCGCTQPKGAVFFDLPKNKRISSQSIKGDYTEPVNNSSVLSVITNNNEPGGRYHASGVSEGYQAMKNNDKSNKKYSDDIQEMGFNYEGQTKKTQNKSKPNIISQILRGGRAKLPEFEEDTPAKDHKKLKRYSIMIENYFKKHRTYFKKHSKYFKNKKNFDSNKHNISINNENIPTYYKKDKKIHYNARTVSNEYSLNKKPITQGNNSQSKSVQQGLYKESQDGQFQSGLFKEFQDGQFQGGVFKESQDGQFESGQEGVFNEYQDSQFKSGQEDLFKESQDGQFENGQKGLFSEYQDGQFKKSQVGQVKEAQGVQFKEFRDGQVKEVGQSNEFDDSLIKGDHYKSTNNRDGQYDHSLRVQETQVQLFNILGDTDIVEDILKNETQTKQLNRKINIDATPTKATQLSVQETNSQTKLNNSKIRYEDKTVGRRLLEINEEMVNQDPNTNKSVQVSCAKNGFIHLKNMNLHSTDTINAVKAVSSNGQTWNWVGVVESNDFFIPLSSVSMVDILYTKKPFNQTKALRVWVPWMPSASSGVCTNFTSASGEWHGARIKTSEETDDILEVVPDTGMRITRIVTTETTSVRAMQLLSGAKTRNEIMSVCMEFKDYCIQREHITMLETRPWVGWQQASLENSLHSPKSFLWVVDLKRSGECKVELGSWLLASTQLKDTSKVSTLFTETVDRLCQSVQAMVLIRPGYAWPVLQTHGVHNTWSITFVELQKVDLWGQVPE